MKFILYTNRTIIILDAAGQQAQVDAGVTQYDVDVELAQAAVDGCDTFMVAQHPTWTHEVSKREVEYLLGLRTAERDAAELLAPAQ